LAGKIYFEKKEQEERKGKKGRIKTEKTAAPHGKLAYERS